MTARITPLWTAAGSNSAYFAHSAGGWEPPIPLDEVGPLPDCPVDALPPVLAEWVRAEAEATQTPPALAMALALSVVATAVSRRFGVQVRPGWRELPVLYVLVALLSGERKTPVFVAATRPVWDYERLRQGELAPVSKKRSGQRDELERRIKKGGSPELIDDLREQLAELVVPPVPRLIVDDITTEKLAVVMQEQGGAIGMFSDEGGIFETLAGRYSGGVPNIDLVLKAYSGTPVRVDRISRQTLRIDRPALTLGLTVQPGVLRGLATKPGFRERGLIARFVFLLPKSMVGRRKARGTPVPESVAAAYGELVTTLLGSTQPPDRDVTAHEELLLLSPEADEAMEKIQTDLEPHLSPTGLLEPIADFVNKLPGTIARIAGLLHCALHADEPIKAAISVETLQNAHRIGMYLLDHARAAFGLMGADPNVEGAQRISTWISAAARANFSKRDVFLALRARFSRVAKLEGPLRVLEEHHIIRRLEEPPRSGSGRPRSPRYEVSPLYVAAQNAQNTQNAERDAISEHGGG